jgi:sodium-dependent dicarboxylate transporter 2/3/5
VILGSRNSRQYIGLAIGPVLFFIIILARPFDGLGAAGHATLATSAWVAIWWVGELIPIAATSLLPIVLLPLSGAAPISQTTAAYGDKMLFLFMGGFIIAIAMEKWNLHKRIALNIIKAVGNSPSRILLGFMVATGLLSMWISNTATTLMMVTIGSAIIAQTSHQQIDGKKGFFKALLLGIAYSASIGGVATLVGTPTNPIFVAIAFELYQEEVSFLQWMTFGFPFAVIVIGFTWYYLSHIVYKLDHLDLEMGDEVIHKELKKLGKISFEEKAVAWVFGLTAFAWISRSFLLVQWLPQINDTSIAIAAACSLFMIPSKKEKRIGLINWEEAVRLPWGVIILFGGGLSIAAAFRSSGLAEWTGQQLNLLDGMPVFLMILFIAILVNFLTEVTSNVATASIMLPILAALSGVIGIHPFLLMIPATMAASCAFMLPVATAPNAIVFASGNLRVKDMARSGFMLNLLSSTLIALLSYWVLDLVFGF